jgi:hypothetical protein
MSSFRRVGLSLDGSRWVSIENPHSDPRLPTSKTKNGIDARCRSLMRGD